MSETITRRAILAHTPAVVAAAGALALPAIACASDVDLLVALWREYFPLEVELKAVNRRRDEIFDSLPEEVQVPRVEYGIYRPEKAGERLPWQPVYAHCDEEIDRLYYPSSEGGLYVWRGQLKRELAEAVRAAELAQERAGVTALDERRSWLCERSEPLVNAIVEGHATGPAGYAVKILTALIWSCDGDDFLDDYPHRIAVSALRDLLPHLPDDIASVARRLVDADDGAKIDGALFAANAA